MNFLPNSTLPLEQIRYVGRNIVSIDGMPFYKSTGDNSHSPETWFPFLGIYNDDYAVMLKGWFIKPQHYKLPEDVIKKMKTLLLLNDSSELCKRFATLPCLLISSRLGGGLWNTHAGKELKRFLEKKYPDFYKNMPKISFKPVKNDCNSENEVNEWLCKNAKLTKYDDLSKLMPVELSDIKFNNAIKKNPSTNIQKATRPNAGNNVEPRLLCLDFDMTLVNGHCHSTLAGNNVTPMISTPGVQVKKNGHFVNTVTNETAKQQSINQADIKSLLENMGLKNGPQMCSAIKNALQNGHNVAVTSFTLYPEVILPALKMLQTKDGQKLTADELRRIYIVGGFPSDGAPDNTPLGKEEHINAAMKHFKIKKRANVMLVDDTTRNLEIARKVGGIHNVTVPKNTNPAPNYFKPIFNFVNKPVLKAAANKPIVNPLVKPAAFQHAYNRHKLVNGKRKIVKPNATYLKQRPKPV